MTIEISPTERTTCSIWLLSIGVEHVLEPHPLRVEIKIDVSHVAVAILPHEKLRRTFDVARTVVHALAIQREHDVGMMLHRAERAEIIKLRPAVRANTQQGKLRCRQYGDARVQRQRFQR